MPKGKQEKENMRVMSLDAEYNQPSGKTIQIGAAAYHLPDGKLLDTLEMLVNPGEPITPYITGVTGIQDSDVTGALSIVEAYEQLRRFHRKYKCFKNPLVWGAGDKNDSQHIYQEAYPDANQYENPNFMGYRVIDVKGQFQSIQLLHNKTVSGGLKDTCERVGIGFEGEAHRALVDAKNAFRLWFYLTKQFPNGFK
jgi:inhibitor of KinA sporulation pathway (predicted exonuclease)